MPIMNSRAPRTIRSTSSTASWPSVSCQKRAGGSPDGLVPTEVQGDQAVLRLVSDARPDGLDDHRTTELPGDGHGLVLAAARRRPRGRRSRSRRAVPSPAIRPARRARGLRRRPRLRPHRGGRPAMASPCLVRPVPARPCALPPARPRHDEHCRAAKALSRRPPPAEPPSTVSRVIRASRVATALSATRARCGLDDEARSPALLPGALRGQYHLGRKSAGCDRRE